MSNISTLLTIADNNAFSNLYEVIVEGVNTSQDIFRLRVENVAIDGYNLSFNQLEGTKEFFIQKATKIRTVSLTLRETNTYFFYNYLTNWFLDFYNPITNTYTSGLNNNVAKKRNILISACGNIEKYDNPDFKLEVKDAMIEKLPNLSFSWADSKPITYQVSFVCPIVNILVNKNNPLKPLDIK